jgi:hypothetical protein
MSILSRAASQVLFNIFAFALILRCAVHYFNCRVIFEIRLWRSKMTSHVWLRRILSIDAQFARCKVALNSLRNELRSTNISVSRLIIFKIEINFWLSGTSISRIDSTTYWYCRLRRSTWERKKRKKNRTV